jgi:hypothetical protein
LEYINLQDVKLNVIRGKKVKFDLTDGYGLLEFRFGKVILTIITETGSSTFKGDFAKIQKTFSQLGELKFYIEELIKELFYLEGGTA